MKAIVHDRYGIDAVELREVERPSIAPDQLLVRVRASSVNPVEWYGVSGPLFMRVLTRELRRPKSTSVGADVAGVVEEVGKDITLFEPGDEVFGTAVGSWAEYAPARESRLARKPANVSFEDAAAVPIAGLTALQAVRDHGRIQPGQKVLINGGSGGVGTFAVQIAKLFGAEVTAVCSTRNVELVESLGADRVCDYTRDDFTRIGERFDVLLDVVGSRPLSAVRRVLEPKATVVVVGAPMSAKRLGPLKHIVGMRVASLGRSQRVVNFVAKIGHDDLAFMAELLESGKVKPVVDRRYELGEAAEALRYLGTTHARGKIVLTT